MSTASLLNPPAPKGRLKRPSAPARPGGDKLASAALLERGQAARLRRLNAPDMANTETAAALAGATRATVVAWIGKGRCIGLSQAKRGFRLPVWQFEPAIFSAIPAISQAMETTEGWSLLSFMETPQGGLDGLTPRQALEQGMRDRVVAIAAAH